MDELKQRAGEKIGAFHEAAKSTVDINKSKVQDAFQQALETFRKIRQAVHEIWHHELIAESRARVAAWLREAKERIKEGAPPLSPVLLYEELVALFKDRVWRRSMLLVLSGLCVGGCLGLALGLRLRAGPPAGPHARALHAAAPDLTAGAVLLVEDAIATGPGAGEVLVRVQAFSVCPVDRAVLRGRGATLRACFAHTPLCVGRAFAGVVLDAGPGVADLELGDEVWGCVSEWAGGAACELLTVRSTRVSKRPCGVSAERAAALPWAGTQALAALHRLAYTPHTTKGKRVVVCGAASGEGCVLLQLLAAWGARVCAVAPRRAARALADLGAQEFLEAEGAEGAEDSEAEAEGGGSWRALARAAARRGPWDGVLVCAGAGAPAAPATPQRAAPALKATAPRGAVAELRAAALCSDRLPAPLAPLFALAIYSYRAARWLLGCGTHTDWLEDKHRLRKGLDTLRELVDSGVLTPVLDKVYLPQEFESALAHACSADALGTTVIRFP